MGSLLSGALKRRFRSKIICFKTVDLAQLSGLPSVFLPLWDCLKKSEVFSPENPGNRKPANFPPTRTPQFCVKLGLGAFFVSPQAKWSILVHSGYLNDKKASTMLPN